MVVSKMERTTPYRAIESMIQWEAMQISAHKLEADYYISNK